MTQAEKYILVKGSCGLGNRILAAATAILYAQISGRKIIIDWTEGEYSAHDINVFPIFFDCPFVQNLAKLPESDSIFPEIWRGRLNQSFGGLKEEFKIKGSQSLSFDVCKLDYPEDIIVFCAYYHRIPKMRNLFTGKFSYLAKMNDREILKNIISNYMNFQEDLIQQFQEFINKNFGKYNLGVHIRYSDMKIPVNKIYDTVHRLKKKKNFQIFLATDSQEIMQDFKHKFNNVITAEKWFPPSGRRLHQNWEECPDRLQNGIEALRDLYLLSQCESLIFSSKSSFGYLASLLNSQGKIYDVEQPSLTQKIRRKLKQIWSS
jgi:hypothetical protein